MTTNQIAGKKLSQIDSQGNHLLEIKEINGHCKYASSINSSNIFIMRNSGNVHAKQTTKGYTL